MFGYAKTTRMLALLTSQDSRLVAILLEVIFHFVAVTNGEK